MAPSSQESAAKGPSQRPKDESSRDDEQERSKGEAGRVKGQENQNSRKSTSSPDPASSPASFSDSDPTSNPSKPSSGGSGLSPNYIATAVSVVVFLLLLRSGFTNVLLVVATSGALLVNPYVRTFLDLQNMDAKTGGSAGSGGSMFGVLDPARYFASFSHKGENNEEEDEAKDDRARHSDRKAAEEELQNLPANLSRAMDGLAPLVIRDFVTGWYNHHSFGHPSAPRHVRFTVDYMAKSVWTHALDTRLKSVDVATELLLTGSSVLQTCLRRKRNAKAAADAGDRMAAKAAMRGGTGHWNSNEERIASLRTVMRKFFDRHLPPGERNSDILFTILTEVLSKQLWNAILTIGEPDYLNRSLVDWKAKQVSAGPQQSHTAPSNRDSSPTRTPSRMSERPAPTAATGREISRPPSARPDRMPSMSVRPPSTAPDRTGSAVGSEAGRSNHGGLSSPSLAASGVFPDRSAISTPPSRSNSPMMPSFGQQNQHQHQQHQPRPAPRTRSSNGNSTQSRDSTAPSPSLGSGASPRMGSSSLWDDQPSASPSQRRAGNASTRDSSEVSDGFSAVVGGFGNAIGGIGRGIGRSADALAGGIGDALVSHQDDTPPRTSSPPSMSASGPRSTGNRGASHAANEGPSRLDQRAPNNTVRRKPVDTKGKRESEASDFLATQAAWPSNLPSELGGLAAEGAKLPEALQNSLRTDDADTSASTQGQRQSPAPMAGPPTMNPSQPYQISPRPSRDISRAASRNSAHPDGQSDSASTLPPSQAPPKLPSRPAAKGTGGDSNGENKENSATAGHSGQNPPTGGGHVSASQLADVLSRSDAEGLYDAFEAFLESPPPSAASVSVAGEGEELLRLHIGLATIERLVPQSAGQEAEMFREDASSILSKARDGLGRAVQRSAGGDVCKPAQDICASLERAISDLGFGPKGYEAKRGTVRDTLQPVRFALARRLGQLYQLFLMHRREAQAAKGTPSRGQGGGLTYEPRKKPSQPPSAEKSRPSMDSSSHSSSSAKPPQSSGPSGLGLESITDLPPLKAPKPRQAINSLIDLDDEDEEDEENENETSREPAGSSGSSGATVSITDISPNVDRPNAQVDTKTYEFMCAVEPGQKSHSVEHDQSGSGSGGFVLVRRWAEVQTMDRELRKLVASAGPQASHLSIPSLPTVKGRTSAMLSSELESYLAAILGDDDLSAAPPVMQFADRSRAATAVNKVGFNPFASSVELGRNFGKNLVEGVGAVGKAATSGLQQQVQGPGGRTVDQAKRDNVRDNVLGIIENDDSLAPPAALDETLGDVSVEGADVVNTVTSGAAPAEVLSASQSSRQGLSPRALDALLTSIFSLADEALSLTGAWSMRRGVVRLLQSVVRQSYSASIVSAFDGTASALSADSVAGWIETARNSFWGPEDQGSKWSHVKGPARSAKERIESEEKARKIALSYAPTQAAFVLGPGGRNACERGIEAVHGVICEDEGALDLVLTLVLRLMEML